MPLQINTTPGLIGINSIAGSGSSSPGEQRISQPKAQMEIDRELPKVYIDQYQCFAEAGLRILLILPKIMSSGLINAFRGIAQYNEEGDMLAQIEKGINPMPIIAENRAFPDMILILILSLKVVPK